MMMCFAPPEPVYHPTNTNGDYDHEYSHITAYR